jgi:hypothetical protein
MVQHMGEFGSGISDEVVRRLLADRKRQPTAAPLTLDD